LVETDCYGGTHRLLTILKDKNNISSHYIDFSDLNLVEDTIKNNQIKLVICESPTNPGLKIIDIQAIASICKKHETLLAIDNSMSTFASQKPLDLGADFSVFSATKFISGHGSVIAGAIASKDKLWHKKVSYAANAHGSAQSPMDVYIISLGLPSLHVRMKAQEESALKIAKFFENHPDVIKVRFPSLPSHPQYELAKKQMKIIPSLLTIDFISMEKAEKLVKNTKLFGEKVSFGTADSRLEIPSKMSHATFTEAQMKEKGLSLSTVRISIGLEDVDDLIEDIKQALQS
jgi:cysteine-S-conjugate beta-lyase